MHRRFGLALIVLSLALSALVAVCAGTADRTKIAVWSWSQEQEQFFKDMEQVFEARNPDIDVEFVMIVQKQYTNSLSLAFRGGTPPDLFFETRYAPELAELGFAKPIDEFLTAKFKRGFAPEYFYEGAAKFNGKIYSLPAGDYSVARPGYLFYNKTVFKQAGLTRPPRTWSELRKYAKQITEKGNGQVYGLAAIGKPGFDLERTAVGLATTVGMHTNIFDFKSGRFAYDNPAWVELYQMLKGIKDDGSFFPGFASMDKTMARTMFAQNRAGMFFDGIWFPSNLVSMGYKDVDYGVAAPPVPDKGRRGYHYLTPNLVPNWYMSAGTKEPAKAWRVLSFIFSQEYQTEFVKRGFGYSALKSVNNAKVVTDPILQEILKIAPKISRLGVMPAMRNPNAGRIEGFSIVQAWRPHIWDAMTAALLGEADFVKEAEAFNAKANQAFAQSIAEAQAKGIKVTGEDFVFPDWNPMQNYQVK